MRIIVGVASFFALAFAQVPPSIRSVINAGSSDARFCPGLLVAITGNNFGNMSGAVSVAVSGQTAGVVSVNNSVIVAQLPFSLSSGSVMLSVNVSGQTSNAFTLNIDSYAPAFYGDSPFGSTPVVPGQTMIATMVGLGATNPLVPVGSIPYLPAPTVVNPTVSVGGMQATVASSVLTNQAVGVYQVSFTVPPTIPPNTPEDIIVSIPANGKSYATPKATVTFVPPSGAPTVSSVTNAGNSAAGFSPGTLVTISGQVFTSPSVVIGGKVAYVAQSSFTSILVQIPYELQIGTADMVITNAAGLRSTPTTLNIAAYAPAFYGPFHDPAGNLYSATNPAAPGKKVIVQMVGLGTTNPGIPSGQVAGTQAQIVGQPTLTVGGKSATYTFCGLQAGTPPGVYELDFTVPPDAPAGTPNVILSFGGLSTPPQPLATTTLVPSLIGFKNAASGQTKDATHGIAPNTFLSIYTTSAGSADSTSNLFPSANFQGTQVLFNGTPVPLYNVIASANLINVVVPSELPESGTANVVITNQNGPSPTYTLNLAPTDVGIFRVPNPTNAIRDIAAITVANQPWIVLPTVVAGAYNYAPCPSGTTAATLCAGPASPGQSIVIYYTGGGKTTPPIATGTVAPLDGSVIYTTTLQPTLTIGGMSAPVQFSGIVPGTQALYQVNTVIPVGVTPGDNVPVMLSFGSNSDTSTIAVKALQ
jgi:uncharacterized protein (TIGR03437 family)